MLKLWIIVKDRSNDIEGYSGSAMFRDFYCISGLVFIFASFTVHGLGLSVFFGFHNVWVGLCFCFHQKFLFQLACFL
jgi:hypothetical protein